MSEFTMEPTVSLDERVVGPGQPVFIIAEIGVNHNGDLELARRLVDSAASCGADCVKLQTFRAEEFISDRTLEYEYDNDGQKVRENMFRMFERLELPAAWHADLMERARKLGMTPLTSVADPLSADLVDDLGMAGFKLSSEDLINLPLIEHVAGKAKPMLLSTGMADEDEARDAVEILVGRGNRKAVFLHCVSVYPTPDAEVNLNRLDALARLVGPNVGYSDHSLGIEAAIGAVARGATVVEKHFTLNRSLPGPDHALSADPEEFRLLVKSIRRIEKMLGSGRLEPSATERETRKVFRRSIVAARDLQEGQVLSRADVCLKRPGHGLKASRMGDLLGRTLLTPVGKDQPILGNMIR